MMEGMPMGYNLDPNQLINALDRNDNNNGGFGGNGGMLWIFLLILFMGGGFGNGFGNRNNGAVGDIDAAIAKAELQGCSDKLILEAINGNKSAINELSRCLGSEVSEIESAVRGLERGICDLGYRNGQDTASIIAQVTSGHCELSRQLADCCCNTQRGIDRVSKEISDATCATNRNIDQVKYDMATGFCAVGTKIDKCCCETKQFIDNKIDAAQAENRAGFQAIRDYMVNEKITALNTELQSAQFQLSQNAQTKAIEDYVKNVLTVSCPKA